MVAARQTTGENQMETKKKCLEPGCHDPVYSRRYCNNHYQLYKGTDKLHYKKEIVAMARVADETLRNSHRFDECWLDHEDFIL